MQISTEIMSYNYVVITLTGGSGSRLSCWRTRWIIGGCLEEVRSESTEASGTCNEFPFDL